MTLPDRARENQWSGKNTFPFLSLILREVLVFIDMIQCFYKIESKKVSMKIEIKKKQTFREQEMATFVSGGVFLTGWERA